MLNEVGIRTVINGPIPVSADGEPVMGVADGIENLFIACGFTAGIAASGGAGLAMANWIATGDPGMDLWRSTCAASAGCATTLRACATPRSGPTRRITPLRTPNRSPRCWRTPKKTG